MPDSGLSFSYPKALRLRCRRDFKRMLRPHKKFLGDLIAVDVRSNNTQATRLGITVTKKFGDAHSRNRFKRIVREAFRLSLFQLISGLDINIRPRMKAKTAKMCDIQNELIRFLKKPSI